MIKKILGFIFLVSFVFNFSYSQDFQAKFELGKIVRDIQSINLIVGLNLTKEQLRKLLTINKTLDDYVLKQESKLSGMIETYSKFRENLISNGFNLDKDIMKQTASLHRNEKDMKDEFFKLINNLYSKAKEVLTDAQKKVLNDYKACLIPTKNLRDPTRIGQAGGNSRIVKLLRRSRGVSQDKIEDFINRIWSKIEKKISRKIKDPVEVARYKELLMESVSEVRNMSEAEFELNKEKIAEKFHPTVNKPFRKNKRGKVKFLVRYGLSEIYQKLILKK